MEFHRVLRAVFNKAKTAVDIAQEIELNRIKNLIESNVVNMFASVVTEGDR